MTSMLSVERKEAATENVYDVYEKVLMDLLMQMQNSRLQQTAAALILDSTTY